MWCIEAYQLSLVRAWYNLAVRKGFCLSQPSLEDFFIILKAIFFCSLSYCAANIHSSPSPTVRREYFPHAAEFGLGYMTCFGHGGIGGGI